MKNPSIKANVLKFILQHTEFEPNIEVCGLLGGKDFNSITSAIPVYNAAQSISTYRMDIDKLTQSRNLLENQKFKWIGIYHSHIIDDAMPSKEDIENMPWEFFYLIVAPKHLVKWTLYYKDPELKKVIVEAQLNII